MKRPDSPSTTEMPPVISVIVPALNEESVIGRCLASLKQQKPPSAHFEVIVVDNGSTDRTREIARSFGGSLSVTVLDRSGVRISALRNLGAAMARGEFLAFLDADCVAPQHWLRQTVDLLRADDFRIIGAQYRIPANSSWVAKAWYGDLWRMKDGPVSYVPGGDLAISRELFMNLGGFDETIVTSEDTEFCERAAASSVPILAVPSLSVVHLGTPQTLEGFYRKQSWHGINVHRVFLRDIRHSKSRKAMLFAVYMLIGIVVAIAGVCAGAISGRAAEGLAGAAVLLMCPLVLALLASMERKKWNYLLSLTFWRICSAKRLCPSAPPLPPRNPSHPPHRPWWWPPGPRNPARLRASGGASQSRHYLDSHRGAGHIGGDLLWRAAVAARRGGRLHARCFDAGVAGGAESSGPAGDLEPVCARDRRRAARHLNHPRRKSRKKRGSGQGPTRSRQLSMHTSQ